METKQKDESLRKLITFSDEDENDNRDNEDTTEDIKLIRLPKCKEELQKEDTEDEESWTLMTKSPDMALPNSKINTSSSAYISDNHHGNSESNECIRNENDECYAISNIMVVDMTKCLSEQVLELDVDEIDCSRFKSWKYQGN